MSLKDSRSVVQDTERLVTTVDSVRLPSDHNHALTAGGDFDRPTSPSAMFQEPAQLSLSDPSFIAAGPRSSNNNLPIHLRDSELSLLEFRRLLETHLFGRRSRALVTYFG